MSKHSISIELPIPSQVRIQRLEKKIRKLIEQRDGYKQKNEDLNKILRYYPYAERTYEKYAQWRKDREELEMLRKRVKEQELFIEKVIRGSLTAKHSDIVSDGGLDPRNKEVV